MAGKTKRPRGRAGRAIRDYCRRAKISQAELARRAGYSRQTLTGIVRGTASPGRELIERLVKLSRGRIRARDLLELEDDKAA